MISMCSKKAFRSACGGINSVIFVSACELNLMWARGLKVESAYFRHNSRIFHPLFGHIQCTLNLFISSPFQAVIYLIINNSFLYHLKYLVHLCKLSKNIYIISHHLLTFSGNVRFQYGFEMFSVFVQIPIVNCLPKTLYVITFVLKYVKLFWYLFHY